MVLGVLLSVVAAGLLYVGGAKIVEQERRAATMKRATGTSLGTSAPGHGRNRDRWAVVEFRTEDGGIVKTRYPVMGDFLVPDDGTPTEVLYDPREPGAVLPASLVRRLFAPVLGVLTTAVGLVLGLALAVSCWRSVRRATTPRSPVTARPAKSPRRGAG
nr:DUF3592 domain-containing protein [Enterovirga rhinocerotis]